MHRETIPGLGIVEYEHILLGLIQKLLRVRGARAGVTGREGTRVKERTVGNPVQLPQGLLHLPFAQGMHFHIVRPLRTGI